MIIGWVTAGWLEPPAGWFFASSSLSSSELELELLLEELELELLLEELELELELLTFLA